MSPVSYFSFSLKMFLNFQKKRNRCYSKNKPCMAVLKWLMVFKERRMSYQTVWWFCIESDLLCIMKKWFIMYYEKTAIDSWLIICHSTKKKKGIFGNLVFSIFLIPTSPKSWFEPCNRDSCWHFQFFNWNINYTDEHHQPKLYFNVSLPHISECKWLTNAIDQMVWVIQNTCNFSIHGGTIDSKQFLWRFWPTLL